MTDLPIEQLIRAQSVIHIPGMVIPPGVSAVLGPGRLERLAFESWRQLDPSFPDEERSYVKSEPVFWVGPGPDPTEDWVKGLQQQSNLLHAALLLGPHQPWLPSPLLSCSYLTYPVQESGNTLIEPLRFIGPLEREMLLYGSEIRVHYSDIDLTRLNQLFSWLESYGNPFELEGTCRAMQVLERTTRPDGTRGFHPGFSTNEFIQAIPAAESLLLPEVTGKNKMDHLGQQAAVLTALFNEPSIPDPASLKTLAAEWREIYRMRNRLLHGLTSLEALDAANLGRLAMARSLLVWIVFATLALDLCMRTDSSSLSAILAEAFNDAEAFHRLTQRTSEVP
jgi:hypothetical protein